MNLNEFRDLQRAGLTPIPINWDESKKTAIEYVNHGMINADTKGEDVIALWADRIEQCNAVALKLFPPFFMVDFDLKNTDDKSIYDNWIKAVNSVLDDFTSKVCIEKTRNNGYHVYCKYNGIIQKQTLAKSIDGKEVIANYTGGLLSFCVPTPGYEVIHGSFDEIQELTEDEFDMINAISLSFNKYVNEYDYANHVVIDYPIEYESIALHFDRFCTEKAFESLLNSIELYHVKGSQRSKDKHLKYLRKGSKADYSAKVYFNSNKLLLFTSSIPNFPSFHSRIDEHDHNWVLTPTKIVYYKCKGDWVETISEIKRIANEYSIELESQKPMQNVTAPIQYDRLKFPYDVFPNEIRDYIHSHKSIQNEYIASFMLASVATAIGNSTKLSIDNGQRYVKPIIYMVVIAPAGASKTPAMSKAFSYLKSNDIYNRKVYNELHKNYEILQKQYEDNKKKGEEPEKPICPQNIIEDSTIEMVVKTLSHNKDGSCIYADELSGFLNRMNRYEKSDEVQKWLSMWSGQSLLVQRITRDDNFVEEPFCCIAGGIQPGILDILTKDQNEHNGFFHRFLYCYPEPQPKALWGKYPISDAVISRFEYIFNELLNLRSQPKRILELSEDAERLYKQWHDVKCLKYNVAFDNNTKGIIAKYQDYCLRLSVIIEIMDNLEAYEVSQSTMDKAIRLTEYFLGNIHKSMQIMSPETPVDKLPEHFRLFYNSLPSIFTSKTAIEYGLKVGIKVGSVKSFLSRNKALFNVIERANYEKIY
jgi:hypothetical protein